MSQMDDVEYLIHQIHFLKYCQNNNNNNKEVAEVGKNTIKKGSNIKPTQLKIFNILAKIFDHKSENSYN